VVNHSKMGTKKKPGLGWGGEVKSLAGSRRIRGKKKKWTIPCNKKRTYDVYHGKKKGREVKAKDNTSTDRREGKERKVKCAMEKRE